MSPRGVFIQSRKGAAAQLLGALCGDVHEEKPAGNWDGRFERGVVIGCVVSVWIYHAWSTE